MKYRAIPYLLILVIVILPSESASAATLEGCTDPELLAQAISTLRNSDWETLSVGRVQAIWPTELKGVDCDRNSCSSIESKGRIIQGRYECSEILFFHSRPSSEGTALTNVVIHYSARDRQMIVHLSKVFAQAAGVSESQAAKMGPKSPQDFHWNNADNTLSVLGLEIVRRGPIWTLTFSLSRYAK